MLQGCKQKRVLNISQMNDLLMDDEGTEGLFICFH